MAACLAEEGRGWPGSGRVSKPPPRRIATRVRNTVLRGSGAAAPSAGGGASLCVSSVMSLHDRAPADQVCQLSTWSNMHLVTDVYATVSV